MLRQSIALALSHFRAQEAAAGSQVCPSWPLTQSLPTTPHPHYLLLTHYGLNQQFTIPTINIPGCASRNVVTLPAESIHSAHPVAHSNGICNSFSISYGKSPIAGELSCLNAGVVKSNTSTRLEYWWRQSDRFGEGNL